MSLQFIHPAFLWGMLLAAVPIIIHLINRRRTRRLEFAAIAFVLRSQQRNARKLRLRRLILLMMRVLLCLAVPLALARPFLAPENLAVADNSRGPTAVVLVLDASMSMRYRLGDETVFERARARGHEVLDALAPEDTVALLPCAGEGEQETPTATYDVASIRRELDAARPTFLPSDLSACLANAARVLGSSPLLGKRIVVVTDLTGAAWRLEEPPPSVTTETGEVRPEIVVVDATDGAPLPNRWLDALTVEPAFALGPRGYAFSFTVRASENAAGPGLSAVLHTGEEVLSRGFVELPPGGSVRKTLSHNFAKGGEVSGQVVLESDALPEDDGLPFLAVVRRDVTALVVDGDPSVNRFEDEVFFVERALQPGRGSGSAIRPTVVDSDGLATTPLDSFDLVMLLDVHRLPAGKAEELISFVAGGGGLFISAGDHVDPDAYNDDLGEVLPARLHVAKAADGGAAALSAVAWNHPVFSIFVGEGREGFGSARFAKYLLTRPPRPGTEVLATYDDGAPAILIGSHGKGRVAVYTSTVDRDWADFPIRTAFLPTIQQLAGYLTRALDERREGPSPVGSPRTLSVPEDTLELTVVDPEGTPTRFEGEALTSGEVLFRGTHRPGVYRVLARRGSGDPTPADGLAFVVVPHARESDTSRIDADELMAHLGGSEAGEAALLTASVTGGDEASTRPLWTWVLLLVAFAFFVEGMLLRR